MDKLKFYIMMENDYEKVWKISASKDGSLLIKYLYEQGIYKYNECKVYDEWHLVTDVNQNIIDYIDEFEERDD